MSYGSFARMSAAALLLLAASAAFAGEYRDPKGIFAVTYDDSIWSLDMDQSGDFGVECRKEVCKEAAVSCSVSTQRIPLVSTERIMANLDSKEIARVQLDAFAEQKVAAEKTSPGKVTWDKASDVSPQLVQPYESRLIAGRSVLQGEFRMSIVGERARYVSYMTAGANHLIAIMCVSSDEAIGESRPRFDGLMARFRSPAPK